MKVINYFIRNSCVSLQETIGNIKSGMYIETEVFKNMSEDIQHLIRNILMSNQHSRLSPSKVKSFFMKYN